MEGTHVVAGWSIPGLDIRCQSTRKQRGHEEAKEERNSSHGLHCELPCAGCKKAIDLAIGRLGYLLEEEVVYSRLAESRNQDICN